MILNQALLFLVLLAVPATVLLWNYFENKTLLYKSTTAADGTKPLLRWLASQRTLLLMAVLLSYSIVIVVYDSKLRSRDVAAINLKNDIETLRAELITAQSIKPVEPLNNIYATAQQPQNPLQEIYDPEETSPGKQSAMDQIKKRFEEILVTYFFLKKCNLANTYDYHIIISALSQEMASVNAPGRLQYDVVVAAKGSFKEIYSKSACDDAGTLALQKQYSDYINSLSANVITQQ